MLKEVRDEDFSFFVVLFSLISPALAEDTREKFYAELRGGVAFLTDADGNAGPPLGGVSGEASFDPGWLIEGALGYKYENGIRPEIAVGYRKNELDDLDLDGGGTADLDGDISAITVMANIYYDINLARLGVENEQWAKLVPYLGGGIGVAFLNVDVDRIGAASGFDRNDTTFAWQVSGGFVYNFNPRWAGTLNYSYFVAEYPSFDVLDIDYASHNVLAGLRYSFD